MQQDLAYRNKYDLVAELDKAKSEDERLQILNQYIAALSTLVSEGKFSYDYEQSQVEYYTNLAKECESSIKEKNSAFRNAVSSYNYEQAELLANEVAELRSCIAKNQVFAKAHASYASVSK